MIILKKTNEGLLVSVVVTTYNRKDLLKETIDSILSQTFTDFELIVVDNYSNYDFMEFMKSFNDSRITAYQNSNDGIIAVNRNFGIKKAKGEYIAFCDDDDIWVQNKLEVQIKVVEQTNCDIVYSNMYLFRGDISNITKKTSNKKIQDLKELISINNVSTSTVLAKNKGFFFPEDSLLVAVEDYALWIDLFIKGFRFEFIEDALVFFRLSSLNTSQKNWIINHLKLIYLFSSIIIKNPQTDIKNKVVKRMAINLLKFWTKETFFKRRYS